MLSVRRISLAVAFAVLSLSGLTSLAGSASAAAVIKSQTPCVPNPNYCRQFTWTGSIPTIRNYNFTAPSKGTAMVQFHGTAVCENGGGVADGGLVIFRSQIVDEPDAVPDSHGPGGLWHGARMLPQQTLASGRVTFNLASTRTFAIPAAGTKSFRFRIARVNMSTDTYCFIYNASFTVVFIP
jgi:hypothetical protein